MSVPIAGLATATSAIPGQPTNTISPNQSGGYIVNPLTAADQGIPTAEPLFVNQVGNAALQANDTTLALLPGQSYSVIPGTTTGVTTASQTPNHQFTAVQWA